MDSGEGISDLEAVKHLRWAGEGKHVVKRGEEISHLFFFFLGHWSLIWEERENEGMFGVRMIKNIPKLRLKLQIEEMLQTLRE